VAADSFMKLASPSEQVTMVSEGGDSETEPAADWVVRSAYCIGNRIQSYALTPIDSFFFSFCN
jgi:hypothetical protein